MTTGSGITRVKYGLVSWKPYCSSRTIEIFVNTPSAKLIWSSNPAACPLYLVYATADFVGFDHFAGSEALELIGVILLYWDSTPEIFDPMTNTRVCSVFPSTNPYNHSIRRRTMFVVRSKIASVAYRDTAIVCLPGPCSVVGYLCENGSILALNQP